MIIAKGFVMFRTWHIYRKEKQQQNALGVMEIHKHNNNETTNLLDEQSTYGISHFLIFCNVICDHPKHFQFTRLKMLRP